MANWLDDLLGIREVLDDAVALPARRRIRFIGGATITDDPDNDATSIAIPGAAGPSSAEFYVDPSSTSPTEDGTIASPYKSITAAVAARAATGGTAHIAVANYDMVEAAIDLPSGVPWAFVGPALLFPGALGPIVPSFNTIGPGPTSLLFSGLEFNSECELAASPVAVFVGCLSVEVAGGDAGITVFGGSVGSVTVAALNATATELGEAFITVSGTSASLVGCTTSLGAMAVTFSGSPGGALYDEVTRGFNSNSPPIVTNGVAVRLGWALRSITGSTVQQQIDSIVDAGVDLGFWTDDR